MPGSPVSPKLFMILVVYYGITDDTEQIREKMKFDENLTSAQWVKLHHECDMSYCSAARQNTSAKISNLYATFSNSLICIKTKHLTAFENSPLS